MFFLFEKYLNWSSCGIPFFEIRSILFDIIVAAMISRPIQHIQ